MSSMSKKMVNGAVALGCLLFAARLWHMKH